MLHGRPATATAAATTLLAPRVGDELVVFARAARAAQRRWAKVIAARESEVRRLMIVEDARRARLRRSVLRRTLHGLKFLVNTDLLAAAQEVAPPPLEAFVAYALPASCVTPFAVYAMAHLRANPDRLAVPPLTLIADMQGAWAVLPPPRRALYEALARDYRAQLQQMQRREAAAAAAQRQKQRQAKAQGRRGGEGSRVATARARVRAVAAQRAGGAAKTAAVTSPAAAMSRARASSSLPPSLVTTTLMLSPSAPAWEQDAFARFARQSLRQTRRAVRGGGGGGVGARAWAPVARAEWASMSLQQKRSYTREDDDDDDDDDE